MRRLRRLRTPLRLVHRTNRMYRLHKPLLNSPTVASQVSRGRPRSFNLSKRHRDLLDPSTNGINSPLLIFSNLSQHLNSKGSFRVLTQTRPPDLLNLHALTGA